jgi:hypothetical protein
VLLDVVAVVVEAVLPALAEAVVEVVLADELLVVDDDALILSSWLYALPAGTIPPPMLAEDNGPAAAKEPVTARDIVLWA